MEQLCGSMAMMDNEGFIRVLGDLMAQNKGFQIMITVPSDKSRECEKKAVKETQEEISLERRDRNAAQDRRSGTYQRISVFERSDYIQCRRS